MLLPASVKPSAITVIKAGLSSYQAWQAAQLADANGAIGGDGSYWGVSLSLGSQHSQSQQLQKQTTNQAGTLTAGRDVAITATATGGLRAISCCKARK